VLAPTGWTTVQLGIALLVPYLCGGTLSWFLVAASGRLGFPALITVLASAALAATAFVGAGWLPLLFAGMLVGSLATATGQGALALHAAARVSDPDRLTTIAMLNLCFLLEPRSARPSRPSPPADTSTGVGRGIGARRVISHRDGRSLVAEQPSLQALEPEHHEYGRRRNEDGN
jgi:hypothetical protein